MVFHDKVVDYIAKKCPTSRYRLYVSKPDDYVLTNVLILALANDFLEIIYV